MSEGNERDEKDEQRKDEAPVNPALDWAECRLYLISQQPNFAPDLAPYAFSAAAKQFNKNQMLRFDMEILPFAALIEKDCTQAPRSF